jgi:hypothetical protein
VNSKSKFLQYRSHYDEKKIFFGGGGAAPKKHRAMISFIVIGTQITGEVNPASHKPKIYWILKKPTIAVGLWSMAEAWGLR